MRKATLIATFLVQANLSATVEDGERDVRSTFLREFPKSSFSEWNQDVDEGTAQHLLSRVGRASKLDIRALIEQLACL